MLFFSRSKRSPSHLLFALVLLGVATPAFSACPLPDGPANTLVPEGYRYPVSGKWKICDKGAWTLGEPVTDAREFTASNTGVCLPLENQFTKKNGVISMNFVPEKSRRNFYGFEHECVASTWWRVPGGATVSDPNQEIPETPAPPAQTAPNPMAGLDDLYDDVKPQAETPPAPTQPPAPREEIPSFSAATPADRPTSATRHQAKTPQAAAPIDSPMRDASPPQSIPGFGRQTENDYQACLDHCRAGQAEALRQAEDQCRQNVPNPPAHGKWNSRAESDFRRCRILAAREQNNALRACLMPCKKQAGKNIWTGP